MRYSNKIDSKNNLHPSFEFGCKNRQVQKRRQLG